MPYSAKSAAKCLLLVMFLLLFSSSWNDSATMDEMAHIPAGYSYLSQQDYRLNPEHPPLIKDLSAIPLLTLGLNFPTDVKAWTEDINGQWEMGKIFIYESGNDADKILRFSRFPIMLLAILFGWLFFKWVRGLYGDKVALLALFLFVFSPTFLAHSKYVTTDLGAAFGFFIGIAAFVNFLFKPNRKNLLITGAAFGVAQLLKFSLVILAPLYLLLGVLWIFLKNYEEKFIWKKFLKEEIKIIGQIILIGLVGLAIIWAFYIPHVWNYPVEKQISDTNFTLNSFGIKPLANLTTWMAGIPVIRGLGQYFLGVLMVIQRAAGGNTAYFLGEVGGGGWPHYFPVLYLLKEHLALHILTLIAIIFGIKNMLAVQEKNLKNITAWLKENFSLTASFIFIAIYWIQAITSPLNIGVRHVLPTFPFIYLLVSRQVIRWLKDYSIETPMNFWEWLKEFYKFYMQPLKRGLLVFILLLWIFFSVIITFPHYLSYYNIAGGGAENGYKIAVDSNYDWGQELKRLKIWASKNLRPDEKIAIDYFGGGNPKYYFGEQYEAWWSDKGRPNRWFALSLTFLQGAAKNDDYSWIKNKRPVARAGKSIFIYKF